MTNPMRVDLRRRPGEAEAMEKHSGHLVDGASRAQSLCVDYPHIVACQI